MVVRTLVVVVVVVVAVVVVVIVVAAAVVHGFRAQGSGCQPNAKAKGAAGQATSVVLRKP